MERNSRKQTPSPVMGLWSCSLPHPAPASIWLALGNVHCGPCKRVDHHKLCAPSFSWACRTATHPASFALPAAISCAALQCGNKLQRTHTGPMHTVFAHILRGLSAAKITRAKTETYANHAGECMVEAVSLHRMVKDTLGLGRNVGHGTSRMQQRRTERGRTGKAQEQQGLVPASIGKCVCACVQHVSVSCCCCEKLFCRLLQNLFCCCALCLFGLQVMAVRCAAATRQTTASCTRWTRPSSTCTSRPCASTTTTLSTWSSSGRAAASSAAACERLTC